MKLSALSFSLLFAYGSLQAAQSVAPANNNAITVNPGTAVTISPYYNTSSPQDSTESGLGIRVHYNSQALSFNQVNNAISNTIRLPDGSTITDLQPISDPQLDTQNYDGDTNTDRYFIVSWVDPNMLWPQRTLAAKLFDAQFTASNTYSGNTYIRFTATATSAAAGSSAAFQAQPITVCIDNNNACSNIGIPGDADGDGDVDLADVLRAYNDVVNGSYNPGADYDGDGDVDFSDVLAIYVVVVSGA